MANQSAASTYLAFRGVNATAAAANQSGYKIAVRFHGGLTASQQRAFTLAADRWTRVIVGQLPKHWVGSELVDGLVIDAQGTAIDGAEGILGAAFPTVLRPASGAFLPAMGQMAFDSADLAAMEANGLLADVIAHEMGHVIGVGTIWEEKGLLRNKGGDDPWFMGHEASRAYVQLRSPVQGPTFVPVENRGGRGTRDSHWREAIFRKELMSGVISTPGNPLSKLTVASLKDLGYGVDMGAAEPYELPTYQPDVGPGVFAAGTEVHKHDRATPRPQVLPESSRYIER